MSFKRKIRIYIIVVDVHIRQDVRDMLLLEEYQVVDVSSFNGMDIVYDVFKPDIVVTYGLSDVQTRVIFNFFAIHLNLPLLMLIRKWRFQSQRDFYESFPLRTNFITAPFTMDEILEAIDTLTADVRADIEWLG